MVFDGILEALVDEGRIELRNFGVFAVKRRRARPARNSRTGENVSVPERRVVTFKPGREIKERVKQSDGVPGQE
jgi:nucleoid DNA-binding protein